jgi:beta-N-acetylhexosaminidase
MSPPLEKRPSLAEIVKNVLGKERNGTTEPDLQKILHTEIENYGRQQGRELADIGINVNFSPVVDLKSVNDSNLLDFHSLINRRAISDDPIVTSDAALAYCIGLDSQGVLPTLKHFPGLGRVSSDTHHFSAKLEAAPDELINRDWLPFQSVSCRSRSLIMLGHVVLSDIDNENPVSFSRRVVQEIIRGRWKHEGLLITDDLTMAAAYSYGIGEAGVRALNAGVDLLLISADHEKFYEAMYYAVDAYENGGVDLKALDTSCDRLEKNFFQ